MGVSDAPDVDRTRQRIAEELFESVRLEHYRGEHLRRKNATEALCGRPAETVWPVHPTDKLCTRCFEAAFAIVDEEADRRFHATLAYTKILSRKGRWRKQSP